MNRYQFVVAAGLICFLNSAGSVAAQEKDYSIARIIKQFDDAYYDRYEEVYAELFEFVGVEGVPRLQRHRNDSIAVQATWQIVAATVPVEIGDKPYEPDVAKIHEFLGFVSGRCKVAIPSWWRDVILGCKGNRRNNIFSGDPSETPYKPSDVEHIECNRSASFSRDGDRFLYRHGQNEMILPAAVLKPIMPSVGKLPYHITGAFTENCLFLTVHGDLGYPHPIYCIDRVTKKVLWESEICGLHWGASSYLGDPESWAEVVPTEDGRVFVFGAAPHGFYMHGFQQADGKSNVLFSNGF